MGVLVLNDLERADADADKDTDMEYYLLVVGLVLVVWTM